MVSAKNGWNWFLLILQTAKLSEFFFCYHHQDFWFEYFFVYGPEVHTEVDISVK